MAQRTVNCMYQPMTWSEGNNRNDHYWCSYHQRNNWAEVSFPETCIRQVKKSCIIARISNMMFSHVSAYETQLLSSGMATSEHHHLSTSFFHQRTQQRVVPRQVIRRSHAREDPHRCRITSHYLSERTPSRFNT